jgi:hypothetical protein
MSTTEPAADDLTTTLAAYRARRTAFEAARAALDERAEPLLRRYVAALLREHPGLNAVALAAYQDYDSSQLTGHAYVRTHALADDAWGRAGFEGDCPTNEVDDDVAAAIEDTLMLLWPSLQRGRGMGWCVALWRDPSVEPDGVAIGWRDHPGFD